MGNVKINRAGAIKKREGVEKFMNPSREKYWDEMDDREKLIRVAEVADLLWNRCKQLEETVEKLKAHEHKDNGEIVVKMGFDKANEHLLGYRYDPFRRRTCEHVPVGHGLK